MRTLQAKQKLDRYVGGFLMAVFRIPAILLAAVLRRDHTLTLGKEAAVIKLAGGGSLLLAYPALLGIRRRYPETRLWLICAPSVVAFGKIMGVFDRILVIDDSNLVNLVASGFRALAQCFRIDTVIDLEVYGHLPAVFSLFTVARNRFSFFLRSAFWRRDIVTHVVFFNQSSGSYRYYEHICRLLGGTPASPLEAREDLVRSLPPIPEDLASAGPYRVGIGHACSALGRERMMDPAQWAEFVRRYLLEPRRDRIEFHFFGVGSDAADARKVEAALRGVLPDAGYVSHCGGLSLAQSVSALRAMDEFWGIDSALLHFARLLGVRCMSFWGPTAPETRLQYVEGLVETAHYRRISCSPCVHVATFAPCNGENLCMRALTAPPGGPVDEDPIWIVR
jgi:ADP-heptose:LPS heptosyltransferase